MTIAPYTFPLIFAHSLFLSLSLFILLPPEVSVSRVWPQPALLYVVSNSHESAKKMREPCADTGRSTESGVPTVYGKLPPTLHFDIPGRDRRLPIRVLAQREASWHGWLPGRIRNLPHTKRCRLKIVYFDTRSQKECENAARTRCPG